MLRAVQVCGVCLCLLAFTGTVMSVLSGYEKPNNKLALRLFRACLAATHSKAEINHWNTYPKAFNAKVPPAIDTNPPGGLRQPVKGHRTHTTLFESKGPVPPEFYPGVRGVIIADVTDGSITVAFANGLDEVHVQQYHGGSSSSRAELTEFCASGPSSPAKGSPARPSSPTSTVANNTMTLPRGHTVGGQCLKCSINHGFKIAWKKVKDVVSRQVDEYYRLGFRGPLYVTGYSLGGAVALLGSIQLSLSWPTTSAATYVFGTPKVGLRDCSQKVHAAKMNVFRVTWPNDPYPLQPISCGPNNWANIGMEYFYPPKGEPMPCTPVSSKCQEEMMAIEKKNYCAKPAQWLLNAICLGHHTPSHYHFVPVMGGDNHFRKVKCKCAEGNCKASTSRGGGGGGGSSRGGSSGGGSNRSGPSSHELQLLERFSSAANESSFWSQVEPVDDVLVDDQQPVVADADADQGES